MRKNFEASLKVLRKFGDIEERVAFPELPFGPVVGTIVDAEGASLPRPDRERPDQGAAGRQRPLGGRGRSMVLAVDYLQAMRAAAPMKKALDELYAKYDALIAPARTTVALPDAATSTRRTPDSARPADHPGRQPRRPAGALGAQRLRREQPADRHSVHRPDLERSQLLAIAAAYQQATDWHRRRPTVK